MQIIISPAKKMQTDNDVFAPCSTPFFIDKTIKVQKALKKFDLEELKTLYKCSDAIAKENLNRLEHMDLKTNLTAAIIAYQGIQYQYMSAKLLTEEDYAFLNEHLLIMSAFYGLLRPFDGVQPYRLEMQAKLAVDGCKDLYDFWKDAINDYLVELNVEILNLASKEYSKIIDCKRLNMVTVYFMEEHKGKLVEKGTMCKMARGLMVKYIANNRITDMSDVKAFDEDNYCFNAELSDEKKLVFTR